MNSKVIKFVAGGGKTTYSQKYLKENKNGIYLAFTNSVVNDVKNGGILAKTIDSFFLSFIIPKFTSVIPLIASNSKIKFIDTKKLPKHLSGVANIHIKTDGKIYNRGKETIANINITNKELHEMEYFPNRTIIKYIFSKEELRLTDELRAELSLYLLQNYEKEIIDLINSRFSYILIDEAQDLNRYREFFAKILYKSDIDLILLGDENQNINGGGDWFKTLDADKTQNESYRCPENNCKWIRDNLGIEIYGNHDSSKVENIEYDDVPKYDDGYRTLLYSQKSGKIVKIINDWKGPKHTIKTAKGSTIENDVVIIGNTLNIRNYYTAITRTKKNVYTTINIKK